MGLCYTSTLSYGLGILGVYLAFKLFKYIRFQRTLGRWSKTPKDVVILHGFPAGITAPNPSPFVLKVQTYLRMTNIPHKMDGRDFFGPKGKTPWISINGEHISDSHFIIQFLNKKFEKNLNGNYSEDKLAIAKLIRLTLEEHIFWGGVLYRAVYGIDKITQVLNAPVPFFILKFYLGRLWQKHANSQGIGRHSQEEVYQITTEALRAVSKIMGNNKFAIGDEPCEDDAAIFGMLAVCVWGLPGSPYEALVNGELKNLKEYALRMKERFWSDWDLCLAKKL